MRLASTSIRCTWTASGCALHQTNPTHGTPAGRAVSLRTRLDAGAVTLNSAGKLVFGGRLEPAPGLYRMTLVSTTTSPARVYIGETDNLRRCLAENYRSPGPRQQTNLRINALLREHLVEGGTVTLALATAATAWITGSSSRSISPTGDAAASGKRRACRNLRRRR